MSTPEVVELRQDIEQHRAELAETVDQLAAKLDVKSRVRAKAVELKPVAIPAAAGAVGLTAAVVIVKRRRS